MASLDSIHSAPAASFAARMTRRRLLRVGLFTLAAVPLGVACSPTPPANPTPAAKTDAGAQPTAATQAGAAPAAKPTEAAKPAAAQPTTAPQAAAKPGSYKEAPQLAQMVKDGKLPPVEQRLPENP